jgi:AcrR family transcriptional regulator
MSDLSRPTDTHELSGPRSGVQRVERRDAAEHRRRILESARSLIAEHGVDAVSMHQIAREAGVGQGTLYRRYAHKGELCAELMIDSWNDLESHIEEIAADPVLRPIVRLDGVLVAIVRFIDKHIPLMSAMHAAGLKGSREEKNDPYYLWMREVIARLCAESIEAGELPALEPVFIADSLLGALQNLYERHGDEYTAEEILDGVRKLFLTTV